LRAGLKRFKAGLTPEEADKLIATIHFEGKDNSITWQQFEKLVKEGAQRLEHEKSYERILVQQWINQFNAAIDKERIPLEKLFYEHDRRQKGSLSFEEFNLMNEQLLVQLDKREQKRVFDIMDKSGEGLVRIDELRDISKFAAEQVQEEEEADEAESQRKEELEEIYKKVKESLERQNATLEEIFYGPQIQAQPAQFLNA